MNKEDDGPKLRKKDKKTKETKPDSIKKTKTKPKKKVDEPADAADVLEEDRKK